jgi:hypothetical protein
MMPDASIAFAALTLRAFSAGEWPPLRPRARLAVKAVRVRSRAGQPGHPPHPCLKTDGSGYGKLDRGNGGGKPTFSAGQRGGFVNRSDGCNHPDHPGQGGRSA